MTDEEFLKITDSMADKLGKDNSALIADDIGLLINGNTSAQNALREKDEEIARLKANNEKLVLANGNLLKQIPVERHDDAPRGTVDNSSNAEVKEEFSWNQIFDSHGRFKR